MGCLGAIALALLLRWFEGRLSGPPNFWYTAEMIPSLFGFAGVAVAATWATQLATGRWRAIPNAIDRLGRFVGIHWLAAGLVFATHLFLG